LTAILGFNCTDGILMLADTEETLSNESKSETDKLYRFRFYQKTVKYESGAVLTGGSGDASLIDYANQEMECFFGSDELNVSNIPDSLARFASKFFRATLRDYRGFPAELIPSIEMLIGVEFRGETSYFYGRETTSAGYRRPLTYR